MPLPLSFKKDGFEGVSTFRKRIKLPNGHFLKPVMIGIDGRTNSGKSEFMLSCPGPAQAILVDRNIDGALDNPNPPASRQENWAFKTINVPLNTMAAQAEYLTYHQEIKASYYAALNNSDSITVAIDGDSDWWELQRLAAFGKLTQVFPQTKYTDVYAAKRAMIARAHDCGKIIIATNKVRDEYETIVGPDGLPVMENGEEKRKKTGNDQRQGFPDQDYLWTIQLRCLYKEPYQNKITGKLMPGKWGIKIIKCKPQPDLKGEELWGDDCCFAGLVQLVYPNVPMEQWNL